MSPRGVVIPILLIMTVLSGCTSSERDLADEAADREAWAREHHEHRPIARLTGPATLAPGALAWFDATGSHDPDFIGAKSDRETARQAGGIHYREPHSGTDMEFSWLYHESGGDGLGPGIREYVWQVDDGPRLVAPELTYRYGTQDGPLRFPFGAPGPGIHVLTLTVIDWSGEKDSVKMEIEVAEGGSASRGDMEGWQVTERGWTFRHQQTIDAWETGRCPLGHDTYDAGRDHVTMPWELLFYSDALQVDATWARHELPSAAEAFAAPPAAADGLVDHTVSTPTVDDAYGINTNDVDLTLGHCARGGEWVRFATDSNPTDEAPTESGRIDAVTLAQNIERTGSKTRYVAEWDHNAYLSGEGGWRGGTGTPVRITYTFEPALDTSGGAL